MKACCFLLMGGLLFGCRNREVPRQLEAPLFSANSQAVVLAQTTPRGTGLHFVDGSERTGIEFRHHADRSAAKHMPEILSGGVVLADFDRNGAVDVVLIDGGSVADVAAGESHSRLFLGDGQGTFHDATEAWGLSTGSYGMGATAADFDGDGWVDLFVTRWGATDLAFRNDEGRRFLDVSDRWGVAGDGEWSTSAAAFDLEPDGDLDLFVLGYVEYAKDRAVECRFHQVRVYCTPVLYSGTRNRLYRNDGGSFTEVGAAHGLSEDPGKSLALVAADLDEDGSVDIYVANDTGKNHLLLNHRGNLTDKASLVGVAYSELGKEEAGMGVDVTDVNRDGLWDVAVTNFQAETTGLYQQIPGFFFDEVSDRVGIGVAARQRLKFGIDFFDADNDGDEDLLVANGHLYDNIQELRQGVLFAQPNTLYENRAAGEFHDVTVHAGPALQRHDVTRGLATADLDQDGDLDFIAVNNDGDVQVALNESSRGRWASLWLEGTSSNRSAIGARIHATVGGVVIKRQIVGGGSYLSGSDPRVHLGLGSATRIDEVRIFWPGSSEPQRVGPLASDQFWRIVEGEAPVAYVPGKSRWASQ